MPGLLAEVDDKGLLEYSVVYTDRALNHMSKIFQSVMRDISTTLQRVYNADAVAVVPGSGTFGMESVARQFATGKNCLVIRNGWFSYRWSQIFEMGDIPSRAEVLMARPLGSGPRQPFAPPPIDEVITAIRDQKPEVIFAPHVETSSGMLLPDEYLQQMAAAVHAHGGLLVLDCIASGALWVDMKTCGVDVLISAPQKGWSGSPCCALVMLNDASLETMASTISTSFACDLARWLNIMRAYENGGHAYHATMPTDALRTFHRVMQETASYGFDEVCAEQRELGSRVRTLLSERGFQSVAAPGFEAPGVVVCYTDDPGISSGSKFAQQGLQIAAGVPLQCGEPDNFQTFRLGLFGLDKLHNIDRSVAILDKALDPILQAE